MPKKKARRPQRKQASFLLGLLLVFAGLIYAAYVPRELFPLDDAALLQVPQIFTGLSWASLSTIFTPGNQVDFYPLRDLSYAVDATLFGQDYRFFHAHQILLFLELICLVFLLLRALLVQPR